jgi:hypothetical protein
MIERHGITKRDIGRLVGPRSGSFDNPKGLIACKQTFLPITFISIGFILMAIIALTTYLGSWALITLIIVIMFMVDQCPFLFETLARVDNNNFPTPLQGDMWYLIAPNSHMFFFCLNNSSDNKWFNFKISSWNVYTIILFPTFSSTWYLKSIVPKICHVFAQGMMFGLQFN